MRILHLFFVLSLMGWPPLRAQETAQPELNARRLDVFIEASGNETRLIFIDILTGETAALNTRGERYTLLKSGVLYFDTDDRQVKLALPDGAVGEHPFIIMPPDAYRVDWAVSADREAIAWTLTRKSADHALMTATFVADAAGSDIREVLADGPREELRVLPIALSHDQAELYMDVHPDGISPPAPYIQYASLFALDLTSGDIRTLPGEPACFLCAAGFGPGLFLRLLPSEEGKGIDVRLDSVHGGAARVIPAIRRQHHTQAGGALISPDGALAVYAAQLGGGGTDAAARTVFVQVNLHTLEQSIVSNPIRAWAHPIKWTEDNSAILFSGGGRNGTWKLHLASGEVIKAADATYLGHLPGRRSS